MGRIYFSFDFEIGWGDVTNPRWKIRESRDVYKKMRSTLPVLLTALDQFEIPVTWATVGAMLQPVDKVSLDHLPVDARDLCTRVLANANSDSFFGRDLFEMVLAANVQHDIACHSYSHVPWHYNGVDAEYVSNDLVRFFEVMTEFGLSPDRLVFPENREGFYDVLAANGINLVRTAPVDGGYRTRATYLMGQVLDLPPAVAEMEDKSGVVRHTGSMLFNSGPGKLYRLPLVYQRAIRTVSAVAAGRMSSAHFWLHPFNFAESAGLLKCFTSVLRKVADERDAGRIQIECM